MGKITLRLEDGYLWAETRGNVADVQEAMEPYLLRAILATVTLGGRQVTQRRKSSAPPLIHLLSCDGIKPTCLRNVPMSQ